MQINIPINPVTKKNSSQIIHIGKGGRHALIPSKAYKAYEEEAGWYIKCKGIKIDYPVNVKALYYMQTHRKVDLANLNSALHDVLVKYGVLKDDNSEIIVSTDGSRVFYDKDYPRTEVYIERVGDDNEAKNREQA